MITRALTLTLTLTVVLTLTAAASAGPDIKLEGSPEVRARLDAMTFKPLDPAVLGALSQWQGGDPLTAEAMKGQVVLLVTWSSWYKTSFAALAAAQALHAKYADKGLIVIGVHHKEGWENAAQVARAQGVQFRTALDTDNGFRKAMFSTQDPDFYLVDRAGRLRFADVETASIDAATELLVNETAEQAAMAAAPTVPAAAPAAAAGDADEPAAAAFAAPSADAYKSAKWPAHNKGDLAAKDFQGKPLPKPMGREKYLDNKKPDTAGRVVVLDFWATWCPPCRKAMPKLDELQARHKQDLVVIGISDEAESKVSGFLKKNPHKYPQAVDPSRTVSNALQIQGIPHVVVLSSDGIIRWQGNPLDPTFPKVVADVIAADPGVAARKAAGKS
jgi:thiol-disulfide isomerase/thioredoxin